MFHETQHAPLKTRNDISVSEVCFVSTDKLAELQESLSEYCGHVTPRSDFYPTIGDVCCAQFSGEDGFTYN